MLVKGVKRGVYGRGVCVVVLLPLPDFDADDAAAAPVVVCAVVEGGRSTPASSRRMSGVRSARTCL